MRNKVILRLFASLLTTAVVAIGATGSGPQVCGLVTDGNRKPIAGATVYLDPGIGQKLQFQTTGPTGSYCFTLTEPVLSKVLAYQFWAVYKGEQGNSLPLSAVMPERKVRKVKLNLHIS